MLAAMKATTGISDGRIACTVTRSATIGSTLLGEALRRSPTDRG